MYVRIDENGVDNKVDPENHLFLPAACHSAALLPSAATTSQLQPIITELTKVKLTKSSCLF